MKSGFQTTFSEIIQCTVSLQWSGEEANVASIRWEQSQQIEEEAIEHEITNHVVQICKAAFSDVAAVDQLSPPLSFASALLACSAHFLLLAVLPAPSPSNCRRWRSSLACCFTTVTERHHCTKATFSASYISREFMRRWLRPGWVTARCTFASASLWTIMCTTMVHSPKAPKTQSLTLP